jgi:transcriptional regulator with XRE-family HTH domain
MEAWQRCGAQFRAVRIRKNLRQEDVAHRAGVHRSVVSRLERGDWRSATMATISAVAAALDMRLQVRAFWHAGDLDRLTSRRHSLLHEDVAHRFERELPHWVLAPEVSFAFYSERGIIDILAWHPGRRALLIIELKTDIVDVNHLVATMDVRRRLASKIAADRGWVPASVSVWVIVADGRTNRARLAAHRRMLRNAFPTDGRVIRTWLRDPTGSVAALSMWTGVDAAGAGLAARHRVSPRRCARKEAA